MENVFGIEVLTRRRANGWTQTGLARMAGCSPSHLSNIERGTTRPDVALMKKIGELLGLSSKEILGFLLDNRSKVEQAIADDPQLSHQARRMLTAAYMEATKA
jgi:transcriptional regulator with XRE-family HTH domain